MLLDYTTATSFIQNVNIFPYLKSNKIDFISFVIIRAATEK